jgi:hypothetical protein
VSPDVVPLDIPPAGDRTRECCPPYGDPFTFDGRAAESGLLLSPACSHSESDSAPQPLPIFDHDLEGMFITVHDFLQDTASRIGRKYGRRNRHVTVKHDTQLEVETRNDQRPISAVYPRIQSRHIAHRVPHPRRKKQLAKSLAQRLFEADVFSSGASPLPTSVRNPAHTSTRRPLQFVTSLNLTPSLESRIYNKTKGHRGGARDGSRNAPRLADSEILAVSNSAQDAPPDLPVASAATSGERFSAWTRNRDTAQRARTGGSAGGVMASSSSGRRAQAFRRARGGKQNAARVTPNPFGYVPLPLVRVKTRKGAVAGAVRQQPIPGHAHAHRCQTNFNFN